MVFIATTHEYEAELNKNVNSGTPYFLNVYLFATENLLRLPFKNVSTLTLILEINTILLSR